MSDPEPVTDDAGNVLGYECPTCGTLKTTGAKATEHCADTDPTQEKATASDAPDTPPFPSSDPEGTDTKMDFTAPVSGSWAAELLAQKQWMGHVEKRPFSPWADRDHPAADDDEDARWKWGLPENYVTGETIAIAEDDPRLDGRVFLQQEDDPYVFVDGDDVRDPESGEVHPDFITILERLGLTYTDISVSGSGAHANYRGTLPNGLTQATFAIDDEPWGANDELPEIEIYAGKHVCVQTGKHVPGTPTDIREWDDDALREVLDEHNQLPIQPAIRERREAFDPTEYTPDTTTSTERTIDIRDQFAAINHIDARRVAGQTIVHSWNDDATTSDGKRAFVPTWGTTANGTANIVDKGIWQDTGGGGYGGPVVMALIDRGDLDAANARPQDASGEVWFRGVEHLRELGYEIPEYDSATANLDLDRANQALAAWRRAKQEGYLPDDDPIPRLALVAIALTEDLCDRADIEDGWKLPREAYDAALIICRDPENGVGVEPGREPIGRTWTQTTDEDTDTEGGQDVDPTTLDVVVDHAKAWRAAKQTTPDDLREGCMETLSLDITDDGEAWLCPHCEGRVGMIPAVALDRGTIDCCEEGLQDTEYTTTYWHAHTGYGAPLPEYVDAETATDNWALVQGAVSELTHYHLSGIESTITGDGGDDDDVIAVIDPCWADSDSGERIVAFRSGVFYCREHERVLDPLRFIALEQSEIEHCDAPLSGETFTRTYHIAREQYGAPLPEWETGTPAHTPVLPPADDLLGEFSTDKSKLDAAREAVTALFKECAMDPLTAHMLTVLPALGKTTAGVILANDHPLLYTAPRRELMQEVAEKARKWGRSWMHLPIFSRYPANVTAVAQALELVYEEGKHLLRDREALLERIDAPVNDEEDDEGEEADDLGEIRDPEDVYPTVESAHDDGKRSLSAARRKIEAQNREITRAREELRAASDNEEIDLDRASCPTANGEHGEAWQLVVHVARMLGHSPKEIHVNDEALFGEELPCQREGDCAYSIEWERALDPDNPNDILIGHYGHAHVEGARVHKARDEDEHVERTQRVVAIDEFPGDTYDKRFGEEFVDHAAWAAKALCPDIEDRQDIFEQKHELATDETLRAWINGTATEDNEAFERLAGKLADMATVEAAVSAAEQCRETLTESDAEGDIVSALLDALDEVFALGPKWTTPAIDDAHAALQDAVDDVSYTDDVPGTVVQQIENGILTPLADARNSLTDSDALGTVTLPDRLGSDLSGLIEGAVTAFRDQREGANGLLQAAQVALAGGEDGCRELALHANDGYAHPMAYLLLHGLIAADDRNDNEKTDEEPTHTNGTRITTDSFDFDVDNDGTNLTQSRHDRHTILTDRNHRGAIIRDPPAFHDGSPNPVVGLDATGRDSLWELAIGCGVETADIHETPREKRAFLRDVLNMQVVQTSPHIQSYSGSPDSTNFDGPVALVRQIADEYSASMLRRDTLSSTTKPGVITTKKAESKIESRIESVIGANEHYGDITGSNALGDHNLGVVLGSRHYGDTPVEKWAAFAGETVTREDKGVNLDYGCPTGNTFLKHMREDETLQAILRFGRDEEGAVVFVHTSALAECLPVVAEGQVVKTFSKNAHAITEAARQYRGDTFAISDLVDDVDCSRETVRRTLNEQAALGYLTKHETKNGLANDYETVEEPGAGEVELPALDDPFTPDGPPDRGREGGEGDHHESPITRYYTWNVEVNAADLSNPPRRQSSRATLPAPEKIAAGPTPN